MSAHNWLKYYVYLRQLPNGQKGSMNFASSLLTFMMSAIWHGFYPGYYIFFSGAALMDYQGKLAERAIAPYFEGMPHIVNRILAYLWCYIGCSYFAVGFTLLSVEKFHQVYMSLYYYFHVILIVSLVVLANT